jgi:hypothetical protein
MSLKTNHIVNARPVGGDYFKLIYARKSNKKLEDYLPLFNQEDYYILKSSGHQRLVTYDDLLEFKYASYVFFKKDLYDIGKIMIWIDWFKSIGGVQYLDKPTPPFNPKKIKIVE